MPQCFAISALRPPYTVNPIFKKGAAILRRGPLVARNILLARLRRWPVSRITGHWINEIPVYCVSLPTATERRSLILSQVENIGIRNFRFVDAVQASDLTYDKVASDGLYASEICRHFHGRDLRLTEIACSISHAKTYQLISGSTAPWSLIIEDDALFRARRLARFTWQQIPTDAQIVFLSSFLHERPPKDKISHHVYGGESYAGSTAAYLISREAAEVLALSAIPVVHAADGLLGRVTNRPDIVPERYRDIVRQPMLRSAIVHPELIYNGSVEYYHLSAIGK